MDRAGKLPTINKTRFSRGQTFGAPIIISFLQSNNALLFYRISPSETDSISSKERWIIVWRASTGLSTIACEEGEDFNIGRFNATCTRKYSHLLNGGFAADFSRKQLRNFLNSYGGDIKSIHLDDTLSISSSTTKRTISSSSTQPLQDSLVIGDEQAPSLWGLDRLDQSDLPLDSQYSYTSLGTGVHVYIIDTGIRQTHEEFRYQDGSPGSRASEVYTTMPSEPSNADCNGHGTHVAASVGGLRYGVAKNVTLHAIRVLNCAGDGSASEVIAALDWLGEAAQRPAIIVMSLGGKSQTLLDQAVDAAVGEGIHVAVAAGNSDEDACLISPARTPAAITVGGSSWNDGTMWVEPGVGTNYGDCIDLYAPAQNILSASNESDTAMSVRTGTSQAVPFVAGAMSLILQQRPTMSPADLEQMLVDNSIENKLSPPPESNLAQLGIVPRNYLLQVKSLSPFKLPNSSGNAGGALILESAVKEVTFDIGLSSWQETAAAAAADLTSSSSTAIAPPSSSSSSVMEVYLTTTDPSAGKVEPSVVTFTADSWQTMQTVTFIPSLTYSLSPDTSPSSSTITIQLSTPSLGVEDQVKIHARKGNSIAFPKYISSLPYEDSSGDTGAPGYADNYRGQCDNNTIDRKESTTIATDNKNNKNKNGSITVFSDDKGPTPEVIYYFKPSTDTTVIISVCNSDSLSIFSGSVYVLEDVDQGGKVVSNYCATVTGFSSSLITGSELDSSYSSCTELEVAIVGGVGYAIIVDGSSSSRSSSNISNNMLTGGKYILRVKSSSTTNVTGLAPPDALLMDGVPELNPIGKAMKNNSSSSDNNEGTNTNDDSHEEGDFSSSSSSSDDLWLIIGGIAAGVVLAIVIIGLVTYLMKSGRKSRSNGCGKGGKVKVMDSDSEESSATPDSLSTSSPPTDIFIAIK
jgi:hypothetical protein